MVVCNKVKKSIALISLLFFVSFLLFDSHDVFASTVCETTTSIAEFFRSCVNAEGYNFGTENNFAERAKFAKEVLGIEGYSGKADQNIKLLAALRGETNDYSDYVDDGAFTITGINNRNQGDETEPTSSGSRADPSSVGLEGSEGDDSNIYLRTGPGGISLQYYYDSDKDVYIDRQGVPYEIKIDDDGNPSFNPQEVDEEEQRENRDVAREAMREERRDFLDRQARASPFMEGARSWIDASRALGNLLGAFGVDTDSGLRRNYADHKRKHLEDPNFGSLFLFGQDAFSAFCFLDGWNMLGNIGPDGDWDLNEGGLCLTNACITMTAEYIDRSRDGRTVLAGKRYLYVITMVVEPPKCPSGEKDDDDKCKLYWAFEAYLKGDDGSVPLFGTEVATVLYGDRIVSVGERTIFVETDNYYDEFYLSFTHGNPRDHIQGYHSSGGNKFRIRITQSDNVAPDNVPRSSGSSGGSGGSGGVSTNVPPVSLT